VQEVLLILFKPKQRVHTLHHHHHQPPNNSNGNVQKEEEGGGANVHPQNKVCMVIVDEIERSCGVKKEVFETVSVCVCWELIADKGTEYIFVNVNAYVFLIRCVIFFLNE
jgi:hypothetical protein